MVSGRGLRRWSTTGTTSARCRIGEPLSTTFQGQLSSCAYYHITPRNLHGSHLRHRLLFLLLDSLARYAEDCDLGSAISGRATGMRLATLQRIMNCCTSLRTSRLWHVHRGLLFAGLSGLKLELHSSPPVLLLRGPSHRPQAPGEQLVAASTTRSHRHMTCQLHGRGQYPCLGLPNPFAIRHPYTGLP